MAACRGSFGLWGSPGQERSPPPPPPLLQGGVDWRLIISPHQEFLLATLVHSLHDLTSRYFCITSIIVGHVRTYTCGAYPCMRVYEWWRLPCLQISVGRLGIITQLTLQIIPQQAVQRSLAQISDAQFAQQVKLTQDAYTSALSSGNQNLIDAALSQLDETQVGSCDYCK